jgi:hypothetical protein
MTAPVAARRRPLTDADASLPRRGRPAPAASVAGRPASAASVAGRRQSLAGQAEAARQRAAQAGIAVRVPSGRLGAPPTTGASASSRTPDPAPKGRRAGGERQERPARAAEPRPSRAARAAEPRPVRQERPAPADRRRPVAPADRRRPAARAAVAPAGRRRPPAVHEPRPRAEGSSWSALIGWGSTALAPDAPGRHDPTAPRHLRVVDPAHRSAAARQRHARLLLGGLSCLAVVVVFGLVYLHVVSAQKQFLIDRLSTEAQTAQTTYENLRLEVDQRDTPEQIMSVATRLGMRQPASVTYLQTTTGAPAASTQAAAASSDLAPAGAADWPRVKPELAGSP